MRNDFCTNYLAHSTKGKEWAKHKYIAKIKLANGKYYYFYDAKEYSKYLAKIKKNGDAARAAINKKYGITEDTKEDSTNDKKKLEVKKTTTTKAGEKKSSSSSSKKKSSSSSSKKKSSSSSSKKKSGSSTGSKSKSSSSESSTRSGSSKSSEGSTKSSSTKANTSSTSSTKSINTTSNTALENETTTKTTPSLSSYKYKYDLSDSDINTYTGSDTERVSTNRVEEIIEDMVDKYPDDSSGYLLSKFSDSITYNFKWVKENGTIKLLDPDTNTEVSADTSLTNSMSISLFRTDDKKTKS